jgi:hypothetical protein
VSARVTRKEPWAGINFSPGPSGAKLSIVGAAFQTCDAKFRNDFRLVKINALVLSDLANSWIVGYSSPI